MLAFIIIFKRKKRYRPYVIMLVYRRLLTMLLTYSLWQSSCVIANNARKTAKAICPRLQSRSSQCNKVHVKTSCHCNYITCNTCVCNSRSRRQAIPRKNALLKKLKGIAMAQWVNRNNIFVNPLPTFKNFWSPTPSATMSYGRLAGRRNTDEF